MASHRPLGANTDLMSDDGAENTFSRAALQGEIRTQRAAVETHEEPHDDSSSLVLSPSTTLIFNPMTASAAAQDDWHSSQSDVLLPGTPQHADVSLTNDSLESRSPFALQESHILDEEADFFDESVMSSGAEESWTGTREDGLLSLSGVFSNFALYLLLLFSVCVCKKRAERGNLKT